MSRTPFWIQILFISCILTACGVKSAPLPPLNEQPVDSERARPPSPSPSPKS